MHWTNTIAAPGGTFFYLSFNGAELVPTPVALGEESVIAIITDSDNCVIDWITDDETYWESAQSVSTAGPRMYYLESSRSNRNIQVSLQERQLYADCFGITITREGE